MQQDVIDLREFYARPLGGVVRHLITHRVRSLWRNVTGMSVFGLGYATPYLTVFKGEATRVGALMHAAQGVVAWPTDAPRQSALVDEDDLPLADVGAGFNQLVASFAHGGTSYNVSMSGFWEIGPVLKGEAWSPEEGLTHLEVRAQVVAEPATLALMGLGFIGMAAGASRRRGQRRPKR